jgi:hypothetical protein
MPAPAANDESEFNDTRLSFISVRHTSQPQRGDTGARHGMRRAYGRELFRVRVGIEDTRASYRGLSVVKLWEARYVFNNT